MSTLDPRRPALAGLAILAIAVAACSGSGSAATTTPTTEATSAPTATPAAPAATAEATATGAATPATGAAGPQTGRIEVADKGFALTLPDGWQSLPLDPAALQSVVQSWPEGSDMRTVMEGQMGSAALQAMALWAFDFSPEATADGVADNLNIMAQPAIKMDLSLVDSMVKAQLGAIEGIGNIESKVVTLPAGDALRLDYTLDVPDATGATTTVAATQFYLPLASTTLIITFTAGSGDVDTIVESIEAI